MASIKSAARTMSYHYKKGIAAQCRLCDEWIYTQEQGASAEYNVLADHLVDSHKEIHDELVKRAYSGSKESQF